MRSAAERKVEDLTGYAVHLNCNRHCGRPTDGAVVRLAIRNAEGFVGNLHHDARHVTEIDETSTAGVRVGANAKNWKSPRVASIWRVWDNYADSAEDGRPRHSACDGVGNVHALHEDADNLSRRNLRAVGEGVACCPNIIGDLGRGRRSRQGRHQNENTKHNILQFQGARINPLASSVYIEPAGLSVTDAAKALQVSRRALSSLLNSKAGLSGEMALRIEKAFGVNMDTLMRMQSSFDIAPRTDHKPTSPARLASFTQSGMPTP